MRSSNEGSRIPGQSASTGAGTQFQRDPDKHYVLVERRNPLGSDFESQIEDYLGGSKNGIIYEIASEEKGVTGHSGKALLCCDRKEFEAAEKERVEMSNAALKAKANLSIPGYIPSLDKFEDGEPGNLEKMAEGLPDEALIPS